MKKPIHVTLVDDDQIYHFVTERLLHSIDPSIRITWFGNGVDAFNALRQTEISELPDVLLVDINMPLMDGWQLIDRINDLKLTERKNCGVYVISSSSDTSDIIRAQSCNVVSAYLEKPLTAEKMRTIIERNYLTAD